MESSVATAVAITVVGMTLLFLTLVFFYGLMVLITTVLKDPQAAPEHSGGEAGKEPREQEAMLRAAAIAVVMARAELEQRSSMAPTLVEEAGANPSTASPWWTFHHQRRLRPVSKARRVP